MIAAKPRTTLALPALLAANILLAIGPWLVRLARAEGEVGPIAVGVWRLGLALPVFLILSWRFERPMLDRRPVAMVAVGGLAFAADLALWHFGILHTRLANSTLLGNLAALLFPLYGFWLARRWPDQHQWIALALMIAGAMLLLGRSYTLSATNLIGDIACVGAGLCYTLYLIAVDRSSGRLPPLATLAICGLAGVPLLLVAALANGETVWPHDWTALLLLALGSQVIGQGLVLYAVARAAPLVVGLMLLSQPIIASAIGWIVYGERLSPADIIGAFAIGAAVVLARGTAKPQALPPTEGSLSSAT